ncbi:MAG TPA: lasso peptide biosynthesis PqqD family chaperone [Acidimicrobiales bacterium]|nr:lasso peptide biosynthesis PqqD family chaperone [Acidimicrobiales bacterium]
MKLRDDVLVADVEYGSALLDEASGQYWSLNPTGVLVLQTLLGGGSREEAARALSDEYGADLETARRDVEELVDGLTASGLLEREGE